jgi:hypothetical protein
MQRPSPFIASVRTASVQRRLRPACEPFALLLVRLLFALSWFRFASLFNSNITAYDMLWAPSVPRSRSHDDDSQRDDWALP